MRRPGPWGLETVREGARRLLRRSRKGRPRAGTRPRGAAAPSWPCHRRARPPRQVTSRRCPKPPLGPPPAPQPPSTPPLGGRRPGGPRRRAPRLVRGRHRRRGGRAWRGRACASAPADRPLRRGPAQKGGGRTRPGRRLQAGPALPSQARPAPPPPRWPLSRPPPPPGKAGSGPRPRWLPWLPRARVPVTRRTGRRAVVAGLGASAQWGTCPEAGTSLLEQQRVARARVEQRG